MINTPWSHAFRIGFVLTALAGVGCDAAVSTGGGGSAPTSTGSTAGGGAGEGSSVAPTTGIAGSTGGSAGSTGTVGSTGSAGSTGSVGTTGSAGSTGSVGTTGSAGSLGSAGAFASPLGAGGAGGGASPVAGAAAAPGTAGVGAGSAPQSGTLTAGIWDDNLNLDFYLAYLHAMEASQVAGLPLIPRASRLEIRATDATGAPLAGARITVSGADGKLFEAPTRGDGKLFFFPGTVGAATGAALQITAAVGAAQVTATAHVGDASIGLVVAGVAAAPPKALDLALVIDTTGSMGDEIAYLKVEMASIVQRVATDYPGVAQRWALILYRDVGDAYVVRTFDFTGMLSTFQGNLAAQSAEGGGDTPEAPEQGLAELAKLSWSPDSSRVAFWLADAPHHVGREQAMAQDVLAAHALGVRLYPIAASGADELLEYTMRTAAEVTGGRYLFLTNDSGVGGDHKEPTIPCYVVTTLAKAMLRVLGTELTGIDVQPAAADIIRTSGNPVNGTCTLTSGQQLNVF